MSCTSAVGAHSLQSHCHQFTDKCKRWIAQCIWSIQQQDTTCRVSSSWLQSWRLSTKMNCPHITVGYLQARLRMTSHSTFASPLLPHQRHLPRRHRHPHHRAPPGNLPHPQVQARHPAMWHQQEAGSGSNVRVCSGAACSAETALNTRPWQCGNSANLAAGPELGGKESWWYCCLTRNKLVGQGQLFRYMSRPGGSQSGKGFQIIWTAANFDPLDYAAILHSPL